MKYELLNKPFKIGNVELRNRFVMLPMTIEKTDNYHVGDDLVDFYEQRAKGGAALIELGSCYVCDVFDTHPKYHTTTGAVGVWDDCFIPGLTRTAEVCHKHGVWFHTDAVQAVGNIDINVKDMNIDMLSLSGHKLHAPKGVGALYVKTGINLPNLIYGGAQERNKRAGTENVPSIVALGVAITDAVRDIPAKNERVRKMRDRLIEGLLKIPESRLNGDTEHRLAGNVNISVRGVEGESLLLSLDLKGVAASSGSACTSGSLDPSHVLLSLGLPHEVAHGSLRLSINDENTEEDVDYILEVLPPIVKHLRSMSPLWERICRTENIHDYTLD